MALILVIDDSSILRLKAATYTWTVPDDTDWSGGTYSNAEKSGTDLVMTNKTTEWTQTDWSGGDGQDNWDDITKYDEDDGGVDVSSAGVIKLNMTSNSYTEDFNDETYLDRTSTTGNWRMKDSKAVAGFTTTDTLLGTYEQDDCLANATIPKSTYINGNGTYLPVYFCINNFIDTSTMTEVTQSGSMKEGIVYYGASNGYLYLVNGSDLGVCTVTNLPGAISCDWGSYAPGNAYDIERSGTKAYLAINNASGALQRYSIDNDGGTLTYETVLDLGVACTEMAIQGDYIYLGCGANGVKVVKISTFSEAGGGWDQTDQTVREMDVQGDYLYLALNNTCSILDVSNPESIPTELVGTCDSANVQDVGIEGRYAFVAGGYADTRIYDVIDPTSPSLFDTISYNGTLDDENILEDNILYTGEYSWSGAGYGLSKVRMDYAASSDIVSSTIDSVDANIYSATLTGTATTTGNTDVSYAMSADGGSNWESVTSGVEHIFANAGSDLRWKATLTTSDVTETTELTGISVDYTAGYDTGSSHTLTSSVQDDLNTANNEWGTVDWNYDGTQTAQVKIRTDSNADMSGATAWASCTAISDGADISANNCVTDGHEFIQYQVILSTDNAAETPSFQDITINTLVYGTDTIIYDASGDAGWVSLDWAATSEPVNTDIKFRFATSDNNVVYSAWSSYSTDDPIDLTSGGLNLAESRYLKTEARLETQSNGVGPTLDNFTATYSQNGPPDVQTVTASQDSTGTVNIAYQVKDADSTSGTVNPGQVSITFQYYNGSSWEDCDTTTGEGLKDVEEGSFTSYSGTWDPATDFDDQYFASTVKIRVTANDNELLYNTDTADSTAFELDTTDPVPGATPISINSAATKTNSTSVTLTLSASDDTSLTQNYSNNGTTYGTVTNDDGGVTDSGTYESYRTSKAWTMASGADGTRTVYIIWKDAKGNTSSVSSDSITYDSTAADIPANLDIDDASDIGIERYSLVLQWDPIAAAANPDYDHYKLESSTNGTSFGTEATFNDITTNYYIDLNLSADNTYYYRIKSVDNINNESSPSTTVSMQPASEDLTPPDLSGEVPASACTQTSCTVAWTTDESATSCVEYGEDTDYGDIECKLNFVLEHEVAISGLTAGTAYHYRVISKDASGNQSTGTDYTMTTASSNEDITPPEVTAEGVIVSPGATSASLAWVTDETADSFVEFGVTRDYDNLQGSETMTTDHIVTIVGLESQKTYHYRVKSTDTAGNTATTEDGTFTTTLPQGADDPPEISEVESQAPGVSTTSVTISWVTDTYSSSQVSYGATDALGSQTAEDTVLNKRHYVTITGLTPATTYYYKARSEDTYGNITLSDLKTFTTAAEEVVTEPEISDVVAQTPGAAETSVTIIWTTDTDTTSQVLYGTALDLDLATEEDTTYTKKHYFTLTDLLPDTKYYYKVRSKDAHGNITLSGLNTFTTSKLLIGDPDVSGVEVSDITLNSAIISWKSFKIATSDIQYGPTANYDSSIVDESSSLTTQHVVRLSGLTSGTAYHFRILSKDADGNNITSDDYVFNTLSLPAISGVRSTDVQDRQITILWYTNIETNSEVEFGVDKSYGLSQGLSEFSTSHSVTLIGLEPNTLYHFKVAGRDVYGNQGQSGDFTFRTLQDTAPPIISDVEFEVSTVSSQQNKVQAIISWVTDELATSQVVYQKGIAAPANESSYNEKTAEDERLNATHVVVLTGIDASATYHFKVMSKDQDNNKSLSEDFSVLTPPQTRSILGEIISSLEARFIWLTKIKEIFGF